MSDQIDSPESPNIIPVNIEEEMKNAYIDYSMSVIVSRALPDVRDGLKPVHRRVLFGMAELGVYHNKAYKKSARIVGEVLGKYHPHGDSSVYDTMVRMAQTWSLRYPLVDGQGNFGSVDGDSPAAMRYTEARLKKIAEELLTDINKNTVDFQQNFDDSLMEPTVLPSKIPHLLMNGTSGIAVGMATNMAPHNLSELVDGILAYIDNHDITIEELMQYILAPDFPTGGIIYGYKGVKSAFETGKGRVVMRAKADIETTKSGKERIIVTEIPYLVNKANLIEKTADLIKDKKIEGISDIRDESDRKGLRIVYELKSDSIAMVVLNNLFKHTALQSTFSINNVALVKGRPHILNLKDLIIHYVDHRHEVVVRRTKYELEEAQKRAHILEGLIIALDNLDEVIELIRKSRDPETARQGLMSTFSLSEIQAKAILDMRLQKLTGLERDKIVAEHNEIQALITDLKEILSDEGRRMTIIKSELNEVKEKYGDERRSEIIFDAQDITDESLIPDHKMVITISNEGYIKRTPLTEYKVQSRGGIGSKGAKTKNQDFTEHLFVASNRNYLLIFTEQGKIFWLKVYKIPEGSKISQGRGIQNLIQIDKEDAVKAIINVENLEDPDYINNQYLMMCTKNGIIKKTSLESYSRPRQKGINAINIKEDDTLLDVKLTDGENHILLTLDSGRSIHFHESGVRAMGRNATGVKGVSIDTNTEKVISMVCVPNSQEDVHLLVLSEKGYGKRSSVKDYRITKRGGKGVKTLNITEKTGKLVAAKAVTDTDELMIINKSGISIRFKVDELRVMGRATQGVKIIKLNKNDEISSVAKVEQMEEDNEEVPTEDTVNTQEPVT